MRVRSGAADDPKVRFHAMKKKDQKKEGVTLSVELRDFVFERLPSPPTLSRRPRSTTTRTPSTSFSNATLSMETRARKRKRERRDATAANAGEAIPGLLNDIVITHVLRSEYFDATASRIARLTAGSRARSAGSSEERVNSVPYTSDVSARCSAGNGEVACRVKNTFVRQRRGVDISRS